MVFIKDFLTKVCRIMKLKRLKLFALKLQYQRKIDAEYLLTVLLKTLINSRYRE